jgi:hypothetical protein
VGAGEREVTLRIQTGCAHSRASADSELTLSEAHTICIPWVGSNPSKADLVPLAAAELRQGDAHGGELILLRRACGERDTEPLGHHVGCVRLELHVHRICARIPPPSEASAVG